jgi:hypothetical protein
MVRALFVRIASFGVLTNTNLKTVLNQFIAHCFEKIENAPGYAEFIGHYEKEVAKLKSGTTFNTNIIAFRMGLTINVKPDTDMDYIHFKKCALQSSNFSKCS